MDTSDKHLPPLFRRLRDARRARGLTQSVLAEQAGCKQSALSMMESGRMDALAGGTVAKIAEILGVAYSPAPRDTPETRPAPPPAGRPICPNGACPSNVPFVVDGELLFWPRRQPAPAGRHCAFCGEVLTDRCRACGTPVTAGACCVQCGAAHVPPPAGVSDEPEAWADKRRRQLADWRAMLDET